MNVQLSAGSAGTEERAATVTHVEDFARATVCSDVTVDGALHHLVGTITEA